MVLDSAGNLYSEVGGGTSDVDGAIFKLTAPSTSGGAWVGSLLYSFEGDGTGLSDGSDPLGGLVVDEMGAFYGTTSRGGASDRGTVFELTPPAASGDAWTESILHRFGGSSNGMSPACSLLRTQNGTLYGTTQAGGSAGAGTIFRLTPPAAGGTAWTENILYNFTGGSDGGTPSGELILDKSGTLYGMTNQGGLGFGTVFELTRPAIAGGAWTESVLYSFTGGSDGDHPLGGFIFDSTGALYGTTNGVYIGGDCDPARPGRCGTVFKLAPPSTQGGAWSYTVIWTFTGFSDGAAPLVGLTLGKNGKTLYGTASGGGSISGTGPGTVFRLTPPTAPGGAWTESTLHRFIGSSKDGGDPDSPLILSGGALYGTTHLGGTFNDGTVFRLVP
ncbi:MAG: choice-of-anchor tandem repeat GloVer-containing protein [Candidatus Sulfotelmatobacter sp.]